MAESKGETYPDARGPASRWSRKAFGAGFLLALAASWGASRWVAAAREPGQPVEFNHRIHVQKAELDCETCHEFVGKESFPGLPTSETCAFCHAEAQGESAEEAKLVELLAQGAPLEWRPLFRQPAHVFFSHRRHVKVAALECKQCHGAFAESERPPRRVRRLAMEDCLECHQRQRVASRCTSCHR